MFEKRNKDVHSGEITRESISSLVTEMIEEEKKLEWIMTVTINGHREEEISYKGVYAGEKGGMLESFRHQNGFAPYTKYRSSGRISSETVVSVLNSVSRKLPIEVVGRIKVTGVPI